VSMTPCSEMPKSLSRTAASCKAQQQTLSA
jgi:hypothetical protein